MYLLLYTRSVQTWEKNPPVTRRKSVFVHQIYVSFIQKEKNQHNNFFHARIIFSKIIFKQLDPNIYFSLLFLVLFFPTSPTSHTILYIMYKHNLQTRRKKNLHVRIQQLHRARYMSFNQKKNKKEEEPTHTKRIRIYIYGQFFTHPNVQKRKIDTYPFSQSISSTVHTDCHAIHILHLFAYIMLEAYLYVFFGIPKAQTIKAVSFHTHLFFYHTVARAHTEQV